MILNNMDKLNFTLNKALLDNLTKGMDVKVWEDIKSVLCRNLGHPTDNGNFSPDVLVLKVDPELSTEFEIEYLSVGDRINNTVTVLSYKESNEPIVDILNQRPRNKMFILIKVTNSITGSVDISISKIVPTSDGKLERKLYSTFFKLPKILYTGSIHTTNAHIRSQNVIVAGTPRGGMSMTKLNQFANNTANSNKPIIRGYIR